MAALFTLRYTKPLDELEEELKELDKKYDMPRWAYSNKEWSEYVMARVTLVRKIKECNNEEVVREDI